MMTRLTRTLALGSALAGLALAGCGPSTSSSAAPATLTGFAAGDAVAGAAVSLKDSSAPAQEKETTADDSGSFSFDVSGLTPPYLLRAAPAGGATPMYAMAEEAGHAAIDPLTTVAVRGVALGENADDLYQRYGRDRSGTAPMLRSLLKTLQAELQPLLDLFGVTSLAYPAPAEATALRALFAAVKVTFAQGTVTILNRATGAVIYAGPIADPASGTFYAENLPPAPDGGAPCAYTYSDWGACQADGTQARTVASATPAGCTGTPALSQPCTYVPPPPAACSYTYSAWGTCQPDGTQARAVLSTTPAGCQGTPVLSQPCTYVPPPPAACTYTYSAWGACQPDGTQARTVASATPTGCQGTPVLSQPCTYVPPPPAACTYTYSAWGACQSNDTQTRTVASATPAGCQGTPVLSQSCTYTPPIDGAALYASKCAGCHGALASSNLKGKNISVTLIKSKGMTQGLTDAQLQAIVDAVGP